MFLDWRDLDVGMLVYIFQILVIKVPECRIILTDIWLNIGGQIQRMVTFNILVQFKGLKFVHSPACSLKLLFKTFNFQLKNTRIIWLWTSSSYSTVVKYISKSIWEISKAVLFLALTLEQLNKCYWHHL